MGMDMNVNKDMYQQKAVILNYLRDRAAESYGEIIKIYGERDFKKRASASNKAIKETTQNLKTIIFQRSLAQKWTKEEILNNILMVTYCSYVIMIEYRNRAWAYEYMTFARRIGELWEPFCKNCFDFPVRDDVELFEPPLFSDVKELLHKEIRDYIASLKLTDVEKNQLLQYYDKVWGLATSGEIKLELDLHFRIGEKRYNVDFKSGFQSNEKGNTNRLLLVASIYKNILSENNECMLFVRANEADNNHYLQTLKNSGIWGVYCGSKTYDQIKEYSGFDITAWISENMKWEDDLDKDTVTYFKENDLVKYLAW